LTVRERWKAGSTPMRCWREFFHKGRREHVVDVIFTLGSDPVPTGVG
jgi:hypothetical protein